MGERKVVFTLTAVTDPALRSTLRDFAQSIASVYDEVRGVQESLQDSVVSQATTGIASVRQELRSVAAERRSIVQAEATYVQATVEGAKTVDEARERIDRLEGARRAKALANFEEMEARKLEIAEAAEKAIEAAMEVGGDDVSLETKAEVRIKIASQAADAIAKIESDLTKARQKEADRVQAYDEKAAQKRLAQLQRDEAAAKRISERAIAEESKRAAQAARRLQMEYEASQRGAVSLAMTHKTKMREMWQATAELGESVMKLARGFVALGLVGEKDLDKVKDALLLMQGSFDMFSGTLQSFIKITRAIEAMRQAIISATAAQVALNTAQSSSAVGGILSGAGSMIGAGVSRVGSMMSTEASRAAKQAAAEAAKKAAAEAAANASAVGSIGAGVGGAGAGVAGTVAAGVGGVGVATVGSAAAAIAGALYGLVNTFATAREAIKNGIANGATADSYVESVGGSAYNPFAWWVAEEEMAARSKSNEDVTRAEKNRTAIHEQTQRTDAKRAEIGSEFSRAYSASSGASEARFEDRISNLSAKERGLAITKEIASEERRAAELKKQANEMDGRYGLIREAMLRASADAEERAMSLVRRRRDVEKEIGAERKAAAEVALQASERQLLVARSLFEESKASLMTAKERFGLMSEEEQRNVMNLARRSQRGERLSVDELKQLQSTGLESFQKKLSDEANRRADAAGFKELASSDTRRLKELDRAQKQLEVVVADKRSVVVTVERNNKELIDAISKQVSQKINESDAALRTELQNAFKQIEGVRMALKNGAGGRN